MMHEDTEHLDEGTIHAWLDDALEPADAARAERHVDACPLCAEQVAEARGLIAGASRVISALDEVRAPLLRPAAIAPAVDDGSLWRALRITPARASIAAVLIVAVGVTLTQQQQSGNAGRSALDTAVVGAPLVSAPPALSPEATTDAAPRIAEASVPQVAQPRRKVEASKTVDAIVPPAEVAVTGKAAFSDAGAGARVGAARQEIAALRDSQGVRADRTSAGVGPGLAVAAAPSAPTMAAANAAERVERRALRMTQVASGTCYRVERTGGTGTAWGDVTLPFVIAFDTGSVARVLTPEGAETQARAVVARVDTDSMTFRLRRIGFTGSLGLGSAAPVRSGFAKSRDASQQEASLTVTARTVSCPGR